MNRCCENCNNWEREPYFDEYFKIMDEHCQCIHPDFDDYRFECNSSNNYRWFEPIEAKDKEIKTMDTIKSYTFTFEGYEDYSIYGFHSTDYQSALDELYKKFPKAVNVECIEFNKRNKK